MLFMMMMHIHQIPVKDHQTLKTLADEIKIFEEILHPNLVQFYGVEIYRVSIMLYFHVNKRFQLEISAVLLYSKISLRPYRLSL